MSFRVKVKEKDLSFYVKSIINQSGAIAGKFQWGPVEDPYHITNGEEELVKKFGKPDADTYESFFSAANFLGYSNSLYVCRVVGDNALNANTDGSSSHVDITVKNSDQYENIDITDQAFIAKYPGTMGNGLKVSIASSTAFSSWEYKNDFDYAPEDGEFNVVVVDTLGTFEDAGTVLETFDLLQDNPTGKKPDGTIAYWVNVINRQSAYIWAGEALQSFDSGTVVEHTLEGGADDQSTADLADGFALFNNKNDYAIRFLIGGATNSTQAGIVADIADSRRDCFAFVSPEKSDVVNNGGNEETSVIDWRGTQVNRNTSFVVYDSNWKYQYDRYNDVNRWVPCNADVAGLVAEMYEDRDVWESPAGYEYGQIRSVVKLAWNPSDAQQKNLDDYQINPIISQKGEGTILFGDKTGIRRPSAFGYINVRSLFIFVEESVADAAKYLLFKLNNELTRTQFTNTVNQFLRQIKGAGGIYDYRVIADETVNTAQIIDEGKFVGHIYIKPARSINQIILTFAAVGNSISFDEIESAGI